MTESVNTTQKLFEYRELYKRGTAYLSDALSEDYEDAKLDARLLLEEVCGTNLQTLLVYPEKTVTAEECAAYEKLLARRAAHEPTAMILGKWEFMGLPFYVNKDVLIPEQDTEVLIEAALDLVLRSKKKMIRVLDMCTGSGCILLSLMHYLKKERIDAKGVGCDLSEKALAVAFKNRTALKMDASAELLQGDLFAALEQDKEASSMQFDLFVSNPPYIPTKVIETLPYEVKSGEPYMALDGGDDGLVFYRRIAKGIRSHIAPDGIIIVEIGYDQGQSVPQVFKEEGFENIEVMKDYGGNDRVVIIRLA